MALLREYIQIMIYWDDTLNQMEICGFAHAVWNILFQMVLYVGFVVIAMTMSFYLYLYKLDIVTNIPEKTVFTVTIGKIFQLDARFRLSARMRKDKMMRNMELILLFDNNTVMTYYTLSRFNLYSTIIFFILEEKLIL